MSSVRPFLRAAVCAAFVGIGALGACGVGGILAASAGGGGGGGGDSVPPPPPFVTVQVPSDDPASNLISIQFELRDPQVKEAEGRDGGADDPRIRIFAEYRIPRFSRWIPMTESPIQTSEGQRALSLGQHVFVWNTIVDLPEYSGPIQVRVRAEYEPTAGIRRRFRIREQTFTMDNRRAATLFGGEITPRADVDTFPVDLSASGTAMLIASAGAGIVERVDALGRIRRVIGVGIPGTAGDGGDPGVAKLENVRAVALGDNGLIYTNTDDRIRVTNPLILPIPLGAGEVPSRTIRTVLEIGGLDNAASVRTHPSGAILYINNRSQLRAFNPQGPGAPGSMDIMLAGTAIPPGTAVQIAGDGATDADGTPASATFLTDATSLAVGPDGEIYVGEQSESRVRVINTGTTPLMLANVTVAGGAIATVAGGNGIDPVGGSGDGGPALDASLNQQGSIDVSPDRELFIADTFSRLVRMVNLGVASQTFAGTTVDPGNIDSIVGDGRDGTGATGGVGSTAEDLRLQAPNAIALGVLDTLVIADGNRVIMVNGGTATITAYGKTALGSRTREIYDASRRAGLPLGDPRAMHTASEEEVFISDRSTIRVLNLGEAPEVFGGTSVEGGGIAVIAGGAVPGFSGDGGPARAAAFSNPGALTTDGNTRLYVADTENHRVRFVNIGDPTSDGSATAFGVTVGPGRVDTIVGTGATGGLPNDGDGLAPRQAVLNSPGGLVAFNGLLFISDTNHHRVRCVNPGPVDETVAGTLVVAGTITTIYGDGTPGFSPDGAGPWLTNLPGALTVDGRGILYIAEPGNARIRALNLGLTAQAQAGVTLAGIDVPSNEVRTIVGTGVPGNFGDGGGGVEAEIENPASLVVQTLVGDPDPNDDVTESISLVSALYFADTQHHVVRVVNLLNRDITAAQNQFGEASITVPGGGIFSIAGGPNALGFQNAPAFDGDGEEAELMRFNRCVGIAITNSGSPPQPVHFFVSDGGNDRLRRFGAPPVFLQGQ